jgi:hypothetical protein
VKATINIEFTDDELRKYGADVGRRVGLDLLKDLFKSGRRLGKNPGVTAAIRDALTNILSPSDAEYVQHAPRTECEPIEGPGLEPGWVCCSCSVYNSLQCVQCKQCAHARCVMRGTHGPSSDPSVS